MTRKEFLERFIQLCDSGAQTVEFRRQCRIKAQHLPRHVRKLPEYRAELARLSEKDAEQKRQEEIRAARLRALEEARRVRAQQAEERAAAIRAAQEEHARAQEEQNESEGTSEGTSTEGDTEALGA